MRGVGGIRSYLEQSEKVFDYPWTMKINLKIFTKIWFYTLIYIPCI